VQVDVNGVNFGRQGDQPTVLYGARAFAIARSLISPITHRLLRFTIPAGHGRNIPVRLVVGGQSSAVDASFSYAPPVITSLQYVNGTQGANITVRVIGFNFGECCYRIRVGLATNGTCECNSTLVERVIAWEGTSCELANSTCVDRDCVISSVTDFDSSSEIVCSMVLLQAQFQVVVGGQRSNLIPYAYSQLLPVPVIKSVPPSFDGGTSSKATIDLQGDKFGDYVGAVMARFRNQTQPGELGEEYLVPLTVVSWSANLVRVNLPEGQGNPTLVLFIPGAEEATKVTFTGVRFAAPAINFVAGHRDVPSNGWTPANNVLLTIVGVNFGPNEPGDYNSVQIVSPTSGVASGDDCAIVSWNHTVVVCRPPPGTGAQNTINVRVFRRDVSIVRTEDMYSVAVAAEKLAYARPRLDTMRLNGTSGKLTHGSTKGGAFVVVTGYSLGVLPRGAATYTVVVRIGPTTLESSAVVELNHDRMVFRTPSGMGKDLPMTLEVNQLLSSVTRFSYDPPALAFPAPEEGLSFYFFDARVFTFRLQGENLGELSDIELRLTSPSGLPDEVPAAVTQLGDTVEVQVKGLRVGPKGVTLRIALQSVTYTAQQTRLVGHCSEGYYALENSNKPCQPCPECSTCTVAGVKASLCAGHFAEPIARPGYWRSAVDPNAAPRVNTTGVAAFIDNTYNFSQCEPLVACSGNNTCGTGYKGAGCAICLPGKYHRDILTGECIPCPKKAAVKLILTFVGVLLVAIVLYKLYQKGPSVAAIGIAVDYFQIISIFGALDMKWPPAIMTVFRVASASASNVDVAAPECSVSVGYIPKWYFTIGLPFLLMGVGGIAHVFVVLYKMYKYPHRRKDWRFLNSHVAGAIGFFLLMFNFMYIMLTRKGFEALECKEVGFVKVLAVDATVKCESASYLTMRRWAYVAVFTYGFGVPVLYAAIIFRVAGRMKVDQALRIRGLSGSRDTNPYYDMQKRFKRLYFKFKPEHYYWTLLIVLRKFVVVLVMAYIGNRPTFASSCIVLVLFTAYALQVRQQAAIVVHRVPVCVVRTSLCQRVSV
jgi:hypothetical protein